MKAKDHLTSKAFEHELNEELKLSEENIIRMRGQFKEDRYTQPLVTAALAIVQTGFSIDCKVFAGNLLEFKAVEPVLNSLKEKYGCRDVYFTADRGINSVESLEKIKEQGLIFETTKQVIRQKEEEEEWKVTILSLDDYRRFKIDGNAIAASDDKVTEDSCCFKICDYERRSYIENNDGCLTPKERY